MLKPDLNSQWPVKNALVYYEKVCVQKGEGKEFWQAIQKSKETISKALNNLKTGQEGTINIIKLGNNKISALFTELEKGFGELYENIEVFTKTCNQELIGKLDALAENNLNKAVELTALIVKKSETEITMFKLVTVFLILGIGGIFIYAIFYVKRTLRTFLAEVVEIIGNLEKGNFKEIQGEKILVEGKTILDSLRALKGSIEGFISGVLSSNKVVSGVIEEERRNIEKIASLAEQLTEVTYKAEIVGQELSELVVSIEGAIEEMKRAISEISQKTHQTSDSVKMVRDASVEMEETVLKLKGSMNEIRNIAETIRDIAEQTNLLALNASIEAARAGEAGKGFAVVANEVKELAKKVSEFTGEIEKIIDELFLMVKETVQKTERTRQMVNEVEKATTIIAGAIEEQSVVVANITDNSRRIKTKNFELTSEIEDIKKVVEKLNLLKTDFQVLSKSLDEIVKTIQISGKLFYIEAKALSDEEIGKFKINAIINLAILGHILWKVSFINSLLREEVPKVERDHRRCLLGRSLGILKEKVKGTDIVGLLEALEGPHKNLHDLVEKCERINLKDKKVIDRFLEEQVLPIFEIVITNLLDIKSRIEKAKLD